MAQYVNQNVGEAGSIDWSSQVVRATGIGAPNPNLPQAAQRASAIEAAKRVALRNLLETIQGMSINSETTVRNAMMENDVINTRVQGVVRGFTVVDTKYMSTGDIDVTVEMPITGALSDVLLPQQMGGTPISAGAAVPQGQLWPANRPVPEGYVLIAPASPGQTTTSSAGGGVYTGLVIDAKGLGIRPAMAPKIVDESGQEIYGSKYVSRDWAVKIGMVGYDKDVTRAKSNDRVTNNPLIVKGLKASGANKADIVVSNNDAALIRNTTANQNFLDKCKVMFIVD
ncbi:LPP20 family lipoprotein [candidate division KSB1 bacterium]|nr:LPP20 family lipoprotein [candidate division KSB1 bacterium]